MALLATEFLAPRCGVANLDRYLVRAGILRMLQAALPRLSGVILDVGCGYMPYRGLVVAPPSRVTKYLGLDLVDNPYGSPDLFWHGDRIPLPDSTIDSALATEVLEHCPDPESVLKEVSRVLRTGGVIFLTVPFLWPLHDVPHDEYRFTPFALERHLRAAGFQEVRVEALGGWDASLAQMIGLWVRGRPMGRLVRGILTRAAMPTIWLLARMDRPADFDEGSMFTGFAVTAVKG